MPPVLSLAGAPFPESEREMLSNTVPLIALPGAGAIHTSFGSNRGRDAHYCAPAAFPRHLKATVPCGGNYRAVHGLIDEVPKRAEAILLRNRAV